MLKTWSRWSISVRELIFCMKTQHPLLRFRASKGPSTPQVQYCVDTPCTVLTLNWYGAELQSVWFSFCYHCVICCANSTAIVQSYCDCEVRDFGSCPSLHPYVSVHMYGAPNCIGLVYLYGGPKRIVLWDQNYSYLRYKGTELYGESLMYGPKLWVLLPPRDIHGFSVFLKHVLFV